MSGPEDYIEDIEARAERDRERVNRATEYPGAYDGLYKVHGITPPDQEPEPKANTFTIVSLGDLASARTEPVRCAIEPIIPIGVVTLLGSHGGAGKTMLSLILGAHVALGMQWGAYGINQGRVLFVSMEDTGARIKSTLSRICNHYWLDPRAVAENFTIIDGTATDAALATELTDFSGKRLIATSAYAELLTLAAGFDLVIIDNASDAFDGNENERRQVRKFVRGMLGRIAGEHDCAVLLLAHIDKAAAKFGGKGNAYSGSTAWHNSARSRLALIDHEKTGLELVHEKHNRTRKAQPQPLKWTDHGMLVPADASAKEDTSEADARIANDDDEAVFDALKAAIESGHPITTAITGNTTHAALKKFDKLPNHLRNGSSGKDRFWAALTRLQRVGRIISEDYEDAYRKDKKRWAIPGGRA